MLNPVATNAWNKKVSVVWNSEGLLITLFSHKNYINLSVKKIIIWRDIFQKNNSRKFSEKKIWLFTNKSTKNCLYINSKCLQSISILFLFWHLPSNILVLDTQKQVVTGDLSSNFDCQDDKDLVLTISVLPSLAACKNLFCRSTMGLSL